MYIYIHFDVVGKKTLVKGSRLLVVTRMQDDFKHVYFIELIFFGWSFFYVLKIKTQKKTFHFTGENVRFGISKEQQSGPLYIIANECHPVERYPCSAFEKESLVGQREVFTTSVNSKAIKYVRPLSWLIKQEVILKSEDMVVLQKYPKRGNFSCDSATCF